MFFRLLAYAVYLVAWVVCGVAFLKGDRPLKLAAVSMIFFWTLTPLVSHWSRGWNMPLTVVDTNALLLLAWISFRWRTLWSAFLVALTFLQVLTPFISVWDRSISLFVLQSAYSVLGYVTLVVMIVATWQTAHARRRADEGAIRS